MALCDCSCGGSKEILTASLLRGATTSCGCSKERYIKTTGDKNAAFKGYKEIRGRFWYGYIQSAAERGHTFDLTMEYAWGIFERQNGRCALSGVLLVLGAGRNYRTTASLDRIDVTKGYIEGNVQWVHKIVNLMRNRLSVEDFIGWCKLVTEYADADRVSEGGRYETVGQWSEDHRPCV
jgi:hypothetical protein